MDYIWLNKLKEVPYSIAFCLSKEQYGFQDRVETQLVTEEAAEQHKKYLLLSWFFWSCQSSLCFTLCCLSGKEKCKMPVALQCDLECLLLLPWLQSSRPCCSQLKGAVIPHTTDFCSVSQHITDCCVQKSDQTHSFAQVKKSCPVMAVAINLILLM